MNASAQSNARLDWIDGYRYGMAHGLVDEATLRATIERLPAHAYRLGVGHRFADGYFTALIERGIWTQDAGTPAPWASWRLPIH